MVEFKRGQTFIDHRSIDYTGNQKAKYYIGLSNAYDLKDVIVCFVLNTEKYFDRYTLGCNHGHHRFIIPPATFSFITAHTSIMLNKEAIYTFEELLQSDKQLLDLADDNLARKIKNCIDWQYILARNKDLIIKSF